MTENSECLVGSAYGIYIPQFFVENYYNKKNVKNYDELITDCEILESGPDNELYWEAWINVCDNLILIGAGNVEYILWQDGDVWAVPTSEIDLIEEF